MVKLRDKRSFAEKALVFLTVMCIFAHLAVFAFVNFRGFTRFCNSDVYADMQVAKRMWEQKTLFPDGWKFGNQCYIFATPVLAALLYGLTGSINTAMILATEAMTVLILLSLLWLLHSFTKNVLVQCVGCLLMLASVVVPYGPYSMNSMLFYTQASFYACYLIVLFVTFGDYSRALQPTKPRAAAWILVLVLSFATGMQSLRQTIVTVLPILVFEVLRALRRVLQHQKPWSRENVGSLIRGCSYAAANLAGIIAVKFMDVPMSPIYGETQLVPPGLCGQRLGAIPEAVCEITQLEYILAGDCSKLIAIVIVFTIALVAAAAVLLLLRKELRGTGLAACWLLCLIGILGVFLSSVVLQITLRGIYAFMWFPLVVFSGLLLLRQLPVLCGGGLSAAVCLLSLASLLYCFGPYLPAIAKGEPTDKAQMSQWAVENGYRYVYGEYWGTAPQIAACSDGALEAGCWHTPENVFQTEPANTPQNIYGVEENAAALYVFTSEDEENGLRTAQERGAVLTKAAQFGEYCAYTSSIPLMRIY